MQPHNRQALLEMTLQQQGSYFSPGHFDLISQVLTVMCLSDSAIYFRFNSIDVKYQVWKLGVVFTDNVSLVVSNILYLICL